MQWYLNHNSSGISDFSFYAVLAAPCFMWQLRLPCVVRAITEKGIEVEPWRKMRCASRASTTLGSLMLDLRSTEIPNELNPITGSVACHKSSQINASNWYRICIWRNMFPFPRYDPIGIYIRIYWDRFCRRQGPPLTRGPLCSWQFLLRRSGALGSQNGDR